MEGTEDLQVRAPSSPCPSFRLRRRRRRRPALTSATTLSAPPSVTVSQETLFKEMRGRIKEDDESVPERRGEFYYYKKMLTGKQYGVRVRRRIKPSAAKAYRPEDVPNDATCDLEEVLLDENVEAEKSEGGFYVCGTFRPSPSHRCVLHCQRATRSWRPGLPGTHSLGHPAPCTKSFHPQATLQCARIARATSLTRSAFSTPRDPRQHACRNPSKPAQAVWPGPTTTPFSM